MHLSHVKGEPHQVRNDAHIHYGDSIDLLVIMGVVLGGGIMDVVNEAQFCSGLGRKMEAH